MRTRWTLLPTRLFVVAAGGLLLAAAALALAAGAPVSAAGASNAAAAQPDRDSPVLRHDAEREVEGPGLAVALRARRFAVPPSEPLALVLELQNRGAETVHLVIGCDPATDFQVRTGEGDLVWRLNPDCVEVASRITLAPHETRAWKASWPGTTMAGSPAPEGRYYIYGFVHLMPLDAVAGPVVVEVDRDAEPPTEPTPKPTKEPTAEPPRFPITDASGRQVRPDVAGNPDVVDCQNLVVWWDETAGEIWGRFIEPEWKGEAFKLSGEHGGVGPPKVAHNWRRSRWLVVWAGEPDGGVSTVLGRYVDCGQLEGEVFTIGRDAGTVGSDDSPAVAAHGEHWAVVWRRSRDGGRHQILGGNIVGLETKQMVEVSEAGAVSEPAIACEDRGDCVVVWSRGPTGQRDVVGRYWFPREEHLGEGALEIAVTPHDERYPSIAWGKAESGAYAVTWTHECDRQTTVKSKLVYRTDPTRLDTTVVGAEAFRVGIDGEYGDHGDVAALGPDFVAVWSTGAESTQHIVARRLGYEPDARKLVPQSVLYASDHERQEVFPAVASAFDPLALAVWQIEWPEGSVDIMGRHIAVPEVTGKKAMVSLVGVLDGGSRALLGPAPRSVTVRRVIEGEFDCETAEIYEVNEGLDVVDPGIGPGDLVSLRGEESPSKGACALTVGGEDTYMKRSPRSQLYIPSVS